MLNPRLETWFLSLALHPLQFPCDQVLIAREYFRPEMAMHLYRILRRTILLACCLTSALAFAQNINLLPKYGLVQKNEAQQAADAKFLTNMDELFKGNRKQAAEQAASRGWQLLREGNTADAMKRFNQAWLLDKTNGSAIWGMAAIQGSAGKLDESLKLFTEAETLVGPDIDFAVDHAKAIGMVGAERKDAALLSDAFARFSRAYDRAPQHTLNLQNWAITLYYVGNYAEAWKKVKLAEATPRRNFLDPKFVAALQQKMPRP